MLLDTGAGNSWVMGSSCTSVPCTQHSTFGPDDSQTYTPLDGESFSVDYGTGQVSGTLANDTISFAGLKLEMTLGIANQTSSDFSSYPMDGILGLSQLQASNQPNFIQTLVAAKLLQSNVFGISLSRSGDGPNNGEINFGAPDTTRYNGDLSYTSVDSNGESDWAIPMGGIGWDGQDSGLTGRLAYLDTGTSFIFCPADDAKALHNLIPGSSLQPDGATYHVPCSTTDPIQVTFSGVTYNISSEDWVGPNTNGECTSNIYGQPVVQDGWLLGDTFLKNVYTLFDVDRNRIGECSMAASALKDLWLTRLQDSQRRFLPLIHRQQQHLLLVGQILLQIPDPVTRVVQVLSPLDLPREHHRAVLTEALQDLPRYHRRQALLDHQVPR